jgi:RecJ-like exonuclease
MFGKIFKIVAAVAGIIPGVKQIWYMIKKDVPRVTCNRCNGSGMEPGTGTPSMEKCHKCNGSGKIRSTEV